MNLPTRRAAWAHKLLRQRLKASDAFSLVANCRVASFDAQAVRERFPEYEGLPQAQKLERLHELNPVEFEANHNVATDAHAEYIVDNLDSGQSVDTSISHVALGDDDSSQPVPSNTQLNNEFARVALGSASDTGGDLQTSTVLGSSEQNGNTIAEVGITDNSSLNTGRLFNHSLVGPVDKTSAKEVTVEVDLLYFV